MFYQKNLPLWERLLRVFIGIVVIAVTLSLSLGGWVKGIIIACATTFLFFGFIGFCPACALFGRKLDAKTKK